MRARRFCTQTLLQLIFAVLGLTGCVLRPPSFGTPFAQSCADHTGTFSGTFPSRGTHAAIPELTLPREEEFHSYRVTARSQEESFEFEAHIEFSSQGSTLVGMTPFGNRGILVRNSLSSVGPHYQAETHPLWPKWIPPERLLALVEFSFLPLYASREGSSYLIERPDYRSDPCQGITRYALASPPGSFLVIDAPHGLTLVFQGSRSCSAKAGC
jgi:hypothetical protein